MVGHGAETGSDALTPVFVFLELSSTAGYPVTCIMIMNFYDDQLTLEAESLVNTTSNNNKVVLAIPSRLNIGNLAWKSCF